MENLVEIIDNYKIISQLNEGMVILMKKEYGKKIYLLFLVMMLVLVGCRKESEDVITNDSAVSSEQVAERDGTEKDGLGDEQKTDSTMEAESTQDIKSTTEESGSTREIQGQNATELKAGTQTATEESRQGNTTTNTPVAEASSSSNTEAATESEFVAYDPQYVAQLANTKVKAAGKILVPEHLDALLAEGAITLEEYNEYYPYDGMENSYYSVFVETNLLEASTTSGRKLGSEDAIATHIADMLALENGSYVYVEYSGIYNLNGIDFYEFRCYR